MSDISQNPAAPAPAAVPAPEVSKDYQALYQQEVAERIKERERYRPVAQTIGSLPAEQQSAILALAEMAAAGDTDGIADWSARTYKNLTGAEVAARVAAQVAGPAAAGVQSPPAPAAQVSMTPDQIADMVSRETSKAVARENAVAQIRGELQAGGFQVGTPSAQTIIAYARESGASIPDAIAWFNADMTATYARSVAAGQQLAGQVPQPAPTGQPAGALPGGTPRERAIARMANGT